MGSLFDPIGIILGNGMQDHRVRLGGQLLLDQGPAVLHIPRQDQGGVDMEALLPQGADQTHGSIPVPGLLVIADHIDTFQAVRLLIF
ncbi:hypothetical protein D3C81_1979400 [compost metagenome]